MRSRRLVAAWLSWLVFAAGLCALAELPLAWKVSVGALVLGPSIPTLWSYVFIRGARAVRAFEWPAGGAGNCHVFVGCPARRLAATPERCRRYGEGLWLLAFRTEEGVLRVVLDARCQDPAALRRMARWLFGRTGAGSGADAR